MTEPTTPLEPPPAPGPRRLLRAHDDRVLFGVAGGLGRLFGVDPLIFRIAFVALAFAGGVGLWAYALAALVVPADDGTGQPAPRRRGLPGLAVGAGGVLLALAALAAAFSGDWWWGGPLVPLALIGAVGYALVRWARREGGTDAASAARAAGVVLLGVAGLAVAAAVIVGVGWAAGVGGDVVLAALVVLIGVALIVAAFRGGARWLVVPAFLLAVPVGVVAAADIDLSGGTGEREHRPTALTALPVDGYELGAGRLEVDLRGADWTRDASVRLPVRLGIGEVVVVVPEQVCVQGRADVGAGEADLLGQQADGADVDFEVRAAPPAGGSTLTLDAEVGLGVVQVVHDPRDAGDHDGDRWDDDDRATASDACATVTSEERD